MKSLQGRVLAGRFRVDEFLGRGGMSEVYKVRDEVMAADLAIKVLSDDLAQDVVFLRRFRREAKTLEALQHPNIVRYYGMRQDGDLTFIVMDYVVGEPLRKEIFQARGKGMPSGRILEIMRPVCSALFFAHQMGVVHCDVKPANIMIETTGRVLVTDFGISRMMDAATATMVGAGTPAYMAPEQVLGRDTTPQTDIYALGVVLYEMVTGGERPFIGERAEITGTTGEKVRWEQRHLAPPSPRIYNPNLSVEIEQIILKCLEKEPENRFPGTLDLLNALQQSMVIPQETLQETEYVTPQLLEEAEADRQHKEQGAKRAEAKRTLPRKGRPMPVGVIFAGLALVVVVLLGGIILPSLKRNNAQIQVITPDETSALGIGSTRLREKDGMEMVYVPAGEFLMGSENGDRDAEENEFPQHLVYLDAYWIDKFEVTNAQYRMCVEDGKCEKPYRTDYYDGEYTNHPVVYVGWMDAFNYCEWAGGRLPSEAEWEKAARGTDGRRYPWGNEEPGMNLANFGGYVKGTTPVGSYPLGASPYGVLDMAGNVWEWTASLNESYPFIVQDGQESLSTSWSKAKVRRGGSYSMNEEFIRSAFRGGVYPDFLYSASGVRCVVSQAP